MEDGVRAVLGRLLRVRVRVRVRVLTHCCLGRQGRAFLVEMNTNGFMPGDDVLYKMQKVSQYARTSVAC